MDNKLSILDDTLIIEPQGIDKILSFQDKLKIPFENITGVYVDLDIVNTRKGYRFPGTGLPNKWAGTFIKDNEDSFWNVTRGEIPLVIELQHEKFSRLVLGVDDGTGWVEKIRRDVFN